MFSRFAYLRFRRCCEFEPSLLAFGVHVHYVSIPQRNCATVKRPSDNLRCAAILRAAAPWKIKLPGLHWLGWPVGRVFHSALAIRFRDACALCRPQFEITYIPGSLNGKHYHVTFVCHRESLSESDPASKFSSVDSVPPKAKAYNDS
jgi:hypothetical protein